VPFHCSARVCESCVVAACSDRPDVPAPSAVTALRVSWVPFAVTEGLGTSVQLVRSIARSRSG